MNEEERANPCSALLSPLIETLNSLFGRTGNFA